MSPKAIILRYTKAVDCGDLAAMGELIDDDFRLEGAGVDLGFLQQAEHMVTVPGRSVSRHDRHVQVLEERSGGISARRAAGVEVVVRSQRPIFSARVNSKEARNVSDWSCATPARRVQR